MKTIGKLKLAQLGKAELEEKQMNALRGGGDDCGCQCGCAANCACSVIDMGTWQHSLTDTEFKTFQIIEADSNAETGKVNLDAGYPYEGENYMYGYR